MTRKNANWLGFGVIQRSSIPHTDQTVVTTAEQDLRSVVRKRHGIHVVFVSLIVVEMKKMRTNERGKEEIGYWIWLRQFVQGKWKRERNASSRGRISAREKQDAKSLASKKRN